MRALHFRRNCCRIRNRIGESVERESLRISFRMCELTSVWRNICVLGDADRWVSAGATVGTCQFCDWRSLPVWWKFDFFLCISRRLSFIFAGCWNARRTLFSLKFCAKLKQATELLSYVRKTMPIPYLLNFQINSLSLSPEWKMIACNDWVDRVLEGWLCSRTHNNL